MTNINRPTPETWREHPDILTDSLWLFDKRDSSGAHDNDFHGNFVPQIPNQLIRRFTDPGDVVLDPFLGSGTTLIEARRLGRHGIGIELNKELAVDILIKMYSIENEYDTNSVIMDGDSSDRIIIPAQVREQLLLMDKEYVQLAILHPPYHDIIKFSDDPSDLSNAPTTSDFLKKMSQVSRNITPLLKVGGFMALVIGDKYKDGQWMTLGFQTSIAVQRPEYRLKSIVVKNIEGNRAKEGKKNLWRYRALKGNFYVFKHEYIFLFQKVREANYEYI